MNNRTRAARAAYLIARNPELLIIEKECLHVGVKKERHHPDYSKPYHVELLCIPCHRKIGSDQRVYTKRETKQLDALSVNIRRIRIKRYMTQGALAAKIGISKQMVSAWESLPIGKSITTDSLALLMDALDASATEILGTHGKIAEAVKKTTNDFFVEADHHADAIV